jgi:hypothetical protein
MKSSASNSKPNKESIDLQTLKIWKYSSTKAKLNWLESALYFGKLKKFKKPNVIR